ncbi:MAG: amino acid adenylation domain-containing protein [Cyclobacteriaceae bacterium]|jgi:amino acid adenylation domain-containing protein
MYQDTAHAYLLSPVQRMVWNGQKKGTQLYRECRIRVSGNLEIEKLKECFEQLAQKYDILRVELVTSTGLQYPNIQLNEAGNVVIYNGEEIKKEILNLRIGNITDRDQLLTVTTPSILLDSVSLVTLIDEAFKIYNGIEYVEDSVIQYLQFAEWQNQVGKDPDEDAIAFWEEQKDSILRKQAYAFERFSEENEAIGSASIETYKEYGSLRQSNPKVIPFIVAAYLITLRKHSDTNNLVIGYVNNERSYEELSKTKGLVAKLLPIAFEVDESVSLQKLVENVEDRINDSIDWEEYLEAVLGDQVTTKLASCFEHINLPDTPELQVSYKIASFLSNGEPFNIKLIALEKNGIIDLRLFYNKRYVSEAAAKVFSEQLKGVLSLSEKTTIDVKSLITEVTPWESDLLNSFAGNGSLESNIDSLYTLIKSKAQELKDKIAIVTDSVHMTYGELIAKSDELAAGIYATHGLLEGKVAAVHLERSEKLIISVLSILKLGGTYLIVDPSWPIERKAFICDDSASEIVITSLAMEGSNTQQLFYSKLIEQHSKEVINDSGNVETAYIIYTSGSTGKPKGVAVSHHSIINYSKWFIDTAKLSKEDRSLLLSSLAYDLSYTSFWPCLIAGGTMLMLEDQPVFDTNSVSKKIIAEQTTYLKLTPSHFKMILDDPLFKEKVLHYNLRLIVLGGEAIDAGDLKKYFEHQNEVMFFNHFGPTETTVGIAFEKIECANLFNFSHKPTIGKAIDNNKINLIAEEGDKLVSIGAVGEICVAGAGVANGYLNNPELTSEKFFKNSRSEIFYRTGDLGRWLPNGSLQYLGRNDNQIKLRGYRIEPGEIEKVINHQETISESCVLMNDGALWAFVKSTDFDEKLMRKYLAGYLPDYMQPARWIVVDEFPLTKNGKIDHSKLQEIAISNSTKKYLPPRNILETQVADIWCRVLNQQKISIEDNFFELGGHSLKATQIVLQVFKHMQVNVSLKELVNNPTIKRFTEVVKQATWKKYESVPVLQSDEVYYDISHAQKRLWLIDQFRENQQAYNIHSSFQINGAIDLPALEEAFSTIIKRHEILRTNFLVINGEVKQFIYDESSVKFDLDVIDLFDDPDGIEKAQQMAEKEMNYIFCLKNDSLIRPKLIKLGEEKHVLILTMHHIIADGWSLRIFMMELSRLYYMHENAMEIALEPLRIQYKDYTYWHNNQAIQNDEKYWLEKLSCPPEFVNLPSNNAVNKEGGNDHELYKTMSIDDEQCSILKALAVKHDTTLSNLMLSAYSIMLNKISGQDDIVIGIGHANRNHPDLENLIGFFVNLLPIRMLFDESDDIESIIKQVSNTTLEAFEHSNYPFELLIEKVCPDRYSNNQPLVNVLYDYKNYHDIDISGVEWDVTSSLTISPFQRLRNRSKFDLTLFIYQHEKSLKLYFEYDDHKFSKKTIDRMNNLLMNICKLLTELE